MVGLALSSGVEWGSGVNLEGFVGGDLDSMVWKARALVMGIGVLWRRILGLFP